mgnify:CR=1 FL=1
MVKQKNHTARNKTVKEHANGIKRVPNFRYKALKHMDAKFYRNLKYSKKWQKGGNWILAGFNFGSLAVGFANAIAIMIMSDAFKGVARHLNERENHRTDTMFEDALIAKSFLFNFVNSFFNLMFTAFIVINFKGITSKFCGPELDCMVQVSNSLMSLMMTKLVVGNIKEVSRCELFSFTAEGSQVSHAHFDFSLSIFIYAQVVVPYFKQRKAEKEAAEDERRKNRNRI